MMRALRTEMYKTSRCLLLLLLLLQGWLLGITRFGTGVRIPDGLSILCQ
jgi:hypothetical protein